MIINSNQQPLHACNVGLCVTWNIESQVTVKRVHVADKAAWHRVDYMDVITISQYVIMKCS